MAAAHFSVRSWLNAKCGPLAGTKQTSEWQVVMLHSQRSRSRLMLSFIATLAGRISVSFRALQMDEPIEGIKLNTDGTNPAFSFSSFGLRSDWCLRLQIWGALSCCHRRLWNIFLVISLLNYRSFRTEYVTATLTGAILESSSTKIFTPGSFAFNAFFTSCW